MNNRNSNNGKVFVPMSIDQSTTYKTSYFMSPLKMSIAILFLIPGVVLGFYAYSSSNAWQVAVVSVLFYIFIYSFIIRFVVLEENKLKRMLKNLEENKVSTNEYFWGIEEIDDEGIIHYRYNNGLKKAVVVKVNRGSLIGVDTDFNRRYTEVMLDFLRSLLRSKFSYMKYSRLEKSDMPPGIRDYIRRMSSVKDDAQRAVMKFNIDVMTKFTKENKNVITDYYVIYNKDIRLMKSFKSLVRDILVRCFDNEVYFRGSKILNGDEVVEFMSEVLNVKNINRVGYYDSSEIKFSEYGNVFRVFDDAGTEVPIELVKEFKRNKLDEPLGSKFGLSVDGLEKKLSREEELKEKERARKLARGETVDDIDNISIFDLEDSVENAEENLSIDKVYEKRLAEKLEKEKLNEPIELILYEDDNGNLVDDEGNIYDEEGNLIQSISEIRAEEEKRNRLSDDADIFSL